MQTCLTTLLQQTLRDQVDYIGQHESQEDYQELQTGVGLGQALHQLNQVDVKRVEEVER